LSDFRSVFDTDSNFGLNTSALFVSSIFLIKLMNLTSLFSTLKDSVERLALEDFSVLLFGLYLKDSLSNFSVYKKKLIFQKF
jgi:uncharacterized protein YhhL (DUF1145 family)